MRLIDADALGVGHCSERVLPHAYCLGWNSLVDLINSAPTVDAVEVVRCKDCDVPHNKWLGCPNFNGLIPPPDFYCARGERKDGEGE